MPEAVFSRLLAPIALRGRKLRNRIVFGAHTANMAAEGLPTQQHAAYYAERAIGGAATARIASLLDGSERDIDADSVVFAATSLAEDRLSRELERHGIFHTAIGDCTAPRQAAYAIHDGRKAAMGL